MGDYADYGKTCPDGDVKNGDWSSDTHYWVTYKGKEYEVICLYKTFKEAIEEVKQAMDFIPRSYQIVRDDNDSGLFAVIPCEFIEK